MNRGGLDPQPQDDEATEKALRQLLRASESTLDFTVTSRLAAARARAVAQSGQWRHMGWLSGRHWGAPALLAAAVVVGFLLHLNHRQAPAIALPGSELATLGGDQIEMAADDSDEMGVVADLDFYQWLDETNAGA